MLYADLRRYYLSRADSALCMARRAANPMTAAIHMDLHSRYLALAEKGSSRDDGVEPASPAPSDSKVLTISPRHPRVKSSTAARKAAAGAGE